VMHVLGVTFGRLLAAAALCSAVLVGAALLGGGAAQAANGDPVRLGQSNIATGSTFINTTGGYGLSATTTASGQGGVEGISDSGLGVKGKSFTGTGVYAISDSGVGLYAYSSSSVGVQATGADYGVKSVAGAGNGVYGETSNGALAGVYGINKATSGG